MREGEKIRTLIKLKMILRLKKIKKGSGHQLKAG